MNVSFNGNGQFFNNVGTAIKNNKFMVKARNVPPSALVATAIVLGAGAYAAHMANKAGNGNFTPLVGTEKPVTQPELGQNLLTIG